MSFLFIFVLFSSQFKLVNLLWSHMVQDPFLPLQVFLGVIVCDSSSERKKLPIFYSDHASDSGKVLFLPTADCRVAIFSRPPLLFRRFKEICWWSSFQKFESQFGKQFYRRLVTSPDNDNSICLVKLLCKGKRHCRLTLSQGQSAQKIRDYQILEPCRIPKLIL